MTNNNENWGENREIQIFQEYLRIRTDHPEVDYGKEFIFMLPKKSILNAC